MKNWPRLVLAFCMIGWMISLALAESVDFNRDIRPILSEKCYYCHGPDEKHREAGLRLDSAAGAADVVKSGEFWSRITTDDPELIMPKPSSKLSLSKSEKELIDKWIKSGAVYDDHWAFRKLPKEIELPSGIDSSWSKQPFDKFIAAQPQAHQLKPSDEAEPLRWLRRVTFDLTGLPPSLKAIEDFQARLDEDREVLYAETVDRLLASFEFGEHLAVTWLDAARYADSYGYQSDKLNNQWPYRDWVIRNLNANLPFDQFLTWQIAGDLLKEPTTEQRLATAFNRIHRLNNEGGAVFEEWRQENVADRVHTFGTAILGLTMECCRCHDHKYDPITTRDYYSLSAFFNSIDENGMYDRTEKIPSPTMLLPTDKQKIALREANAAREKAKAHYRETVDSAKPRWKAYQESMSGPVDETSSKPVLTDLKFEHGFDIPWDKSLAKVYSAVTLDKTSTSPLVEVEVTDSKIHRLGVSSTPRQAFALDGERGMLVHNVEPLDRWTPFSVVVTFREAKRNPLASVIAQHSRGTDAGYNGWDLMIEDGYVESRLYRIWPGNAIGIRSEEPIPPDQWHQIVACYDGSSEASGLSLYLNGKKLATKILRDKLLKSCMVKVDHGGNFVLGQRFRARGFDGGLIDDARLFSRALSETEIEHLALGTAIDPTFEYFTSVQDESCRVAWSAWLEAEKAFVMAEESIDEIPVMEEMVTPRPAYVLARGEYDAPKTDETMVHRDIPAKVGLPFPADAARDRLGLAQWVVDPEHPLTGRVIVNRLWANFFGAGIVRTPENFGLTGEQPTHPELLDWLARDFIANGWDVKRFCKNVVLSATYRQKSYLTQEGLSLDPENRWLARGPSHRLSAEQIRDLTLAASGLLCLERGGPPVSPYQAGGDLWRENNGMSPPYQQSVGEALHRRSIYSVWKRTAPLPNMMAFDTNSREVCTVKRQRTNTPLQALVLMNDIQFVEASRYLSEKLLLLNDSGKEIDREWMVRQAFKALTGRDPRQTELGVLEDLYLEERKYYRDNVEEAKKLTAVGETPERCLEIAEQYNLTVDGAAIELAAWTNVTQAILNLDATIWSR
jgi:Protein of unknown function (DUF1553)/Protein of unknown function (DUF1549)/Concanavalin A-like lectin/glucanases superfamily/Planctomycete cytochrome C